ncbi:MAG: hypothetical protein E7633_06030 [Ruminococcaceae bacterium]|nr:hypothetical protein [Oscillospiraceae bacterium]
MKNIFTRIISCLLAILMLFSLISCNDEGEDTKNDLKNEENVEKIPEIDGIYSGTVTVENRTTGEKKVLEGYDAEYMLYAFNSMKREQKNTGTSAEYLIKFGETEIYYNLSGIGNDMTNGTVTGLNQKRRPTVDEILERNVGKAKHTVSGIVTLDVGRLGEWVTLTEEESKEICDFLNSLEYEDYIPCDCDILHRLVVSGYTVSFEDDHITWGGREAVNPPCRIEDIIEKYFVGYNDWKTSDDIPDVEGIYSGEVTVENMVTGAKKVLDGYEAKYMLYAFNSVRSEKSNTGTSAEYLIKFGETEMYYNLHGVGNDITNGLYTALDQKTRPTVDEILERNVGRPGYELSGVVKIDAYRLGIWVTLTEEESKEVCDFLNSLEFVEREPCECVLMHRLVVSGYEISFEEKEIRGLRGIASDPACNLESIVGKYLKDENGEEKCPYCGNFLFECNCDDNKGPYSPFTCPTSSSTVYGVTTENNALAFNDVWGVWEVITEGDLAGSVHATADGGANIGLITGIDFTKAKKVTISADFLLPEKKAGNNSYGFILDVWAEPGEDKYFFWETDFNSYYYCLQSGSGDTGTLIGKWGASSALGEKNNGWMSFDKVHGVQSPATKGLEFRYGEWTNLKVVWDVENDAIEMYYNGQLTKKVDFNETTFKFTNDGDNGVGIRSNRGDVYYKNINLIVE